MNASPAEPGHQPTNFQLRLATAAAGLPLVVAAIWIGGWFFAVLLGLVALLAATEFVHGWLFPTRPVREAFRLAPAFGAAAVMVAGAHFSTAYVVFGSILGAILVVSGYLPSRAFGPRKPYRVVGGSLLYVGLLVSTAVLVRDAADGRNWLLLGVLSTFAVDTSAYALGRAIGRHKLAPKISPKKTIEGAVGGYAAGVACVFALNELFDTGVPAGTVAHFALVMPLFAEAGDLIESWMKRRMGVKDASGLLPGHGGFLDRLDSLVFVIPLLYLFLRVRVL